MTVREILRSKGTAVHTIASGAPLHHVAGLLARYRIGALPVLDDAGRLVGIVSERDLVQTLAEHGVLALGRPVTFAMSAPVETCGLETPVREVLRRMTAGRLRHLPVLDADHLVGIVSIGDAVKHRLRDVEVEAGVLRDYITLQRAATVY